MRAQVVAQMGSRKFCSSLSRRANEALWIVFNQNSRERRHLSHVLETRLPSSPLTARLQNTLPQVPGCGARRKFCSRDLVVVVLNSRTLKIALLVLVVTRAALSDVDLMSVTNPVDKSVREAIDELDAKDANGCFSLGELDITFRTHNNGEPNIGVVLTDPRGRRIGFDPLTKHAWQDLPVAQGYIDCDDLGGADTCQGAVQVCGPLSGTYRLEVIAQQTTAYSVSISARSKEVLDGHSLQCYRSEADLQNVAVRARSRNIVLLNYSRDGQEKVTAQLQHPPGSQNYEAHFHRHPNVTARK